MKINLRRNQNMKISPISSFISAVRPKNIWGWIGFIGLVFLLCCAAVFLWWGVSSINHLMTFHPTGKIVFVSASYNPHDVCRLIPDEDHKCQVNPDGSGRMKIIETPPYQSIELPGGRTGYKLVWSPDKKHIAFRKSSRYPALVIHQDGKNETLLLDKYVGLVVIDQDGKNETLLTTDEVEKYEWSPDSKKIVFDSHHYRDKDAGLFVIDQDGKNKTLLTKENVISYDWSPDSTKIAFDVYLDHTTTIYVVNSDGSNLIALTNDRISASPAWSPDGKKIAYSCRDGLCIMNPDGGGQTYLIHYENTYSFQNGPDSPIWSPDGQYIAYNQEPFCPLCWTDTSQLWVMHADGTDPTRITDGPLDYIVSWEP
jgi:Tol biopolymer transport system component